MDFLKVELTTKNNKQYITPSFVVDGDSKDLMVRGNAFYAIWDEENNIWSRDESHAIKLIDQEISKKYEGTKDVYPESTIIPMYLRNGDSKMIDKWHHFIQKQMVNNYHQLDESLTFLDDVTKKKDYRSKRLPYNITEGSIDNYDKLMSVIYSPEERQKIEWAIGAVISGDSKKIQKFIILTGDAGTGKSTVIKIIQMLFQGYTTAIDARAIGSSQATFALEPLKHNPLVAFQDDADLTKLSDNTRLNSLVSHERITVNEKFKSAYEMRFNAFIFLGSNGDVNITDARSGMQRRVIDVRPTDKTLPYNHYRSVMKNIEFELGAIAYHCLEVYKEHKHDYDKYKPLQSIRNTNPFYGFLEEHYFEYKDGVTLSKLWNDYLGYCEESGITYHLHKHQVIKEAMAYFEKFTADTKDKNRNHIRNYFQGLRPEKFGLAPTEVEVESTGWLNLSFTRSLFDEAYAEEPAQYSKKDGTPKRPWDSVRTTLSNIDTTKEHYVRLPEKNHICIDFDLKNEAGEKDKDLNLKAASEFPPTYAEYSRGGNGIHLHYFYDGDPTRLEKLFDTDIEIKRCTGKAALRRRLSFCNDIPMATISSGLPLKGEKSMVNTEGVKNEKHLRAMIKKALRKEVHPNTAPNVDFIKHILDEAYAGNVPYDVSDMREDIAFFAMDSTHQSEKCMELVSQMHFSSEENKFEESTPGDINYEDQPIVFYDIEVFPNLFLVNWKKQGVDTVVRMINPEPKEVEDLFNYRLVGFNNRRYDNHIMYARAQGYSIPELFNLSQRIVNENGKGALFGQAYNLSYADVYDFAAQKQGLKKWEIELDIHHQELGLPWDQPVPEEDWVKVAEYCDNDVIATETVFNHLHEDFNARKILAELSGLTVNDTTRQHATKIIFGDDRKPPLIYTDLSELFPGYVFDRGKSSYMGENPSEGGYVYAEPGIYGDAAVLDIASMHPTSILELNLFGPYTDRFRDIVDARLAIKRKDKKAIKTLLGGVLEKYAGSDEEMDNLAYALKIVINSVYGFTAATFPNPFRDSRNKDNIVAKRGALFMITLKNEVQKRGYTVSHIKTDSIKIPDADQNIIDFVFDFGKQYGYTFEHEATYDKFCLVNDAVYIAKYKWPEKKAGQWDATGAEFQHPYIYKSLFTREPIEFKDMCETKTVTTALYLDMNENLPEDEHDYVFVGRAGSFVPIKPGCGGGVLLREKEGKYSAATGTKGYRWLEAETVKLLGKEDDIDLSYFEKLVEDARKHIQEYTDFDWFVGEVPYNQELPFHEKMNPPEGDDLPWYED